MYSSTLATILVTESSQRLTCGGRLAIALVLLLITARTQGQEKIQFPDSIRNEQTRRVLFELDATGKIHLRPSGEETDSRSLSMVAKLDYLERHLETGSVRQVGRFYNSAQADINVGRGSTTNSLPDSSRYFVIESSTDSRTGRLRLRKPNGTVEVEEAELLEVPLESAMIDCLLPAGQEVAIRDTWQASSTHLASLLWLDSVTHNAVECRLFRVQANQALIAVSGKVLGAVDGVSTEIDVNGSLTYDLAKQTLQGGRFTIHEKRSIGQAQPGFDVTAKIEFRMAPEASSSALSDAIVAEWALKRDSGADIATYQSRAGGFEFLHNRRWRVISDRHNATVLRLVDQGDMIAQCNITRLENLTPGTRIELDKFRNDVRQAIARYGGQLVDAQESTGNDDRHIMRVSAAGNVEDVSLMWIYYHITDAEGRRAASVVSMESDRVERFAEHDQLIMESIKFHERTGDEAPEEADGPAESAADRDQDGETIRK